MIEVTDRSICMGTAWQCNSLRSFVQTFMLAAKSVLMKYKTSPFPLWA